MPATPRKMSRKTTKRRRSPSKSRKPAVTSATAEDLNPYHIAQAQFDAAALYLPQVSNGLGDYLKRPDRVITIEFPIEMADGSVRTFTGFRVLHNRARGPGKGGIRYHPGVTSDEIRALA